MPTSRRATRLTPRRITTTALQRYTAAQSQAPGQVEPAYNAANTYYRQNVLDKAQQTLEPTLAQPGNAIAEFVHFNLGNIAYNAKQFDAAIAQYEAALRLQPTDRDAKYNLELALQQKQQQDQQQQQQQRSKTSRTSRTSNNRIRISRNKINKNQQGQQNQDQQNPQNQSSDQQSQSGGQQDQQQKQPDQQNGQQGDQQNQQQPNQPDQQNGQQGDQQNQPQDQRRANRPVSRISLNPISRMVRLTGRARSKG